MAKAVSKRALRELIEVAESFCDHLPDDHAPGHCDYCVITQRDLSQILEEAQ